MLKSRNASKSRVAGAAAVVAKVQVVVQAGVVGVGGGRVSICTWCCHRYLSYKTRPLASPHRSCHRCCFHHRFLNKRMTPVPTSAYSHVCALSQCRIGCTCP